MNHTKTFFHSLLLLLFCIYSSAKQLDSSNPVNQTSIVNAVDSTLVNTNESKEKLEYNNKTITDSIVPLQKTDSISIDYPPKKRDFRRLGYNSALYVGAAVVVFSILWVSPESFSHWDKAAIRENGILWKWKQNVKAGPVMDQDSFFINYVTHPYSGAIYYMTARSSGFTVFESFGYSAIMSTFFWEYGIEAFAEIPSIQDLISTPILGSAIGESFFYAKKKIMKNNKRVLNSRFLGGTTLFLIDPFNTILDGFGYKEKVKTQMTIAPVGFDASLNKTIWGVNFSASF
jgi:hypothetical protein